MSVTLLASSAHPIAVAMCIGSLTDLPTLGGIEGLSTEWLPPLFIAVFASALALVPALAVRLWPNEDDWRAPGGRGWSTPRMLQAAGYFLCNPTTDLAGQPPIGNACQLVHR